MLSPEILYPLALYLMQGWLFTASTCSFTQHLFSDETMFESLSYVFKVKFKGHRVSLRAYVLGLLIYRSPFVISLVKSACSLLLISLVVSIYLLQTQYLHLSISMVEINLYGCQTSDLIHPLSFGHTLWWKRKKKFCTHPGHEVTTYSLRPFDRVFIQT